MISMPVQAFLFPQLNDGQNLWRVSYQRLGAKTFAEAKGLAKVTDTEAYYKSLTQDGTTSGVTSRLTCLLLSSICCLGIRCCQAWGHAVHTCKGPMSNPSDQCTLAAWQRSMRKASQQPLLAQELLDRSWEASWSVCARRCLECNLRAVSLHQVPQRQVSSCSTALLPCMFSDYSVGTD